MSRVGLPLSWSSLSIAEAYVEAKAAEARRVQSAAASKVAARQKNGSKLQTQLSMHGKKAHFKPPVRDALQDSAALATSKKPTES